MDKSIEQFTSGEYKEGFVTKVEQEFVPKGLSEDIIRTFCAYPVEDAIEEAKMNRGTFETY